MGIINDNFLLKNETAIKLYHDFAKDMMRKAILGLKNAGC